MALKAFMPSKRNRVRHNVLRGLKVVDAHPCSNAKKGRDRESSSVARGADRRQHVIWADAVITKHLGGMGSDKQPPIMTKLA